MKDITTRLAGAAILAAALVSSLASLNMKRMSEMMRRMSGSVDRPTMKEPEMRRQFGEMRRQMDEMSRSHSMGDPGKGK